MRIGDNSETKWRLYHRKPWREKDPPGLDSAYGGGVGISLIPKMKENTIHARQTQWGRMPSRGFSKMNYM
jgi:hypothetical protein